MIMDFFSLALTNLRRSSKRSWLTMLGIFIGIASVVALISLSAGMQAVINDQLNKIGSNRITITAGSGSYSSPVTGDLFSSKLYQHDVDIVRQVRGVDYAIGVSIITANVDFRGETKSLMVFGLPFDTKTVENLNSVDYFSLIDGSYPPDNQNNRAVIGYELTKNVFEKPIGVGSKITINGFEFDVSGVTKKSGNPIYDRKIMISLETAKTLFGIGDEVSTITARSKPGFNTTEVSNDISDRLRRDRGLKKGEEDFTVQTAQQMIKSFTVVLDIVQLFLIGIAAISLLVGGIGIMNTMYTSVLEQTRNIGIMKAVGAKERDIMAIFLFESGILGAAGGAIGTFIGIVIGLIVQTIAANAGFETLKAYIAPDLIIGAILFSFIVGCVSGLTPARRAAEMNPMSALRYE
ncbi:MAG: ABC transporter permease [Candidatus Aenigmatarchaeota archaeon]